jgi:ADP-ribosyl-[dinitrogen reductase] hydrolase
LKLIERYRGALLGLAAGDALGTTVEFKQPGTFAPVTEMIGGGSFELDPGQWTDDTSMALCLAESLIETGGFDMVDQLRRYFRWYIWGHWSSTGRCFDIGGTTRDALRRFEETLEPYSGPTSHLTAGNGSLMRLAPVPLRYRANPEKAIQLAGESSRTTHGALMAVDACRYFGGLIVGALAGADKATLLSERYAPVPAFWERNSLASEIDGIARGSFARKHPPDIKSSGFVVDTLEVALWAFANSSTFEEGCCMAVNLGWDADTSGAVYGQIAGAYYGESGIPERWRKLLTFGAKIEEMADRLLELSLGESGG